MNEAMEQVDDVTKQTPTVRVRQIVIEGLFGQYTHRIPLSEQDRVTILHGRNGVGKTITLSMIAALLSGNQSGIEQLKEWPFDTMQIEFSDDTFVEARQQTASEPKDKPRRGRRSNARKRRNLEISWPNWPESPEDVITASETALDATYFRLVDRVKVHYVNTHRLDTERTEDEFGLSTSVSAMAKICADMVSRINEVDVAYRETSSSLDDNFAARLFASPPNAAIDPGGLATRNEALEHERSRLREIGLLAEAKTSFHPNNLDKTKQAMFAVYLEDNEKKLAVFKDLADRAEILLDVLNSKLAPKRVRLDSGAGYQVYSHDNQPLDLEWLSSGEQHEFVLLHNLLFHVEPGSLLLIDEPELSLHVTWQNEFLEDLIRIAKMIGFDAIIATHSPYIVGSRRDLMVQLGAPE
jgi:predicted ATPase